MVLFRGSSSSCVPDSTLAADITPQTSRCDVPTAFRAGGDMIVLFDAYTRHRFEGVRSRDLKVWTPLGGELQMPPGARHGTVFAVPEKILKGLLAMSSGPSSGTASTRP